MFCLRVKFIYVPVIVLRQIISEVINVFYLFSNLIFMTIFELGGYFTLYVITFVFLAVFYVIHSQYIRETLCLPISNISQAMYSTVFAQ
jgi:hypothetical protein